MNLKMTNNPILIDGVEVGKRDFFSINDMDAMSPDEYGLMELLNSVGNVKVMVLEYHGVSSIITKIERFDDHVEISTH